MSYQNPPPHPGDDTTPTAPRISRRTTIVVESAFGSVVRVTLPFSRRTATFVVFLLIMVVVPLTWTHLTIYVFAPWLAGLLNIDPFIVMASILAAYLLVLVCPSIWPTAAKTTRNGRAAYLLVLVCPSIIRRVRARSAVAR